MLIKQNTANFSGLKFQESVTFAKIVEFMYLKKPTIWYAKECH